jgi:hypothetical protein
MSTIGPEDRERFARREAETPYVTRRETESEQTKSIKVVAGGSVTEAICGVGAVVLAILGLAGLVPGYMAAIATITFGVALLAQGGAIASRWSRLIHETGYEVDHRAELGGGMGAEVAGGAAGVVLGVLSLIGIATTVLIPIAAIVFGGALLLGSGATADLSTLSTGAAHERFAHTIRQATVAASGAQVLLGISAIVLGIIALVSNDPITVSLVALIVVGTSALFSGGALSGRMAALMRR